MFWKLLINLILGFFQEPDGKSSSKRVTAFWFVVLITFIIITSLRIESKSAISPNELKNGTLDIIHLMSTEVLYALISAVLVIFGVTGWQYMSIKKGNNTDPGKSENTDNPQQ